MTNSEKNMALTDLNLPVVVTKWLEQQAIYDALTARNILLELAHKEASLPFDEAERCVAIDRLSAVLSTPITVVDTEALPELPPLGVPLENAKPGTIEAKDNLHKVPVARILKAKPHDNSKIKGEDYE